MAWPFSLCSTHNKAAPIWQYIIWSCKCHRLPINLSAFLNIFQHPVYYEFLALLWQWVSILVLGTVLLPSNVWILPVCMRCAQCMWSHSTAGIHTGTTLVSCIRMLHVIFPLKLKWTVKQGNSPCWRGSCHHLIAFCLAQNPSYRCRDKACWFC